MTAEQFTKRKKVKICGDTTYENSIKDWTQCCFLLPKKMKLCNIGRSPGSIYCGNHKFYKCAESAIISDNCNEQDTLSRTVSARKKGSRMSCPVDPSHTIYSANLQKHILVCAATTKIIKMKTKPYYIENCNADLSTSEVTQQIATVSNPIKNGSTTTTNLLISKINLAYQNMMDKRDILAQGGCKQQSSFPLSYDGDTQSTDFEAVAENIRCKLRSNGISNSESSSSDEPLSAYWRLRHVEQDVALVKELVSRNILRPNSSCDSVFVEVGAGKGLLGLAVGVTLPTGRFVFLEKAGSRKKVDRYFRDNGILFERIVMDIRHCYLPRLPFIWMPTTVDGSGDDAAHIPGGSSNDRKVKQVAVIAKHLCGAATDLTLRGLLPFVNPDVSQPEIDLCIATCCHHVCNYVDYVGKEWYHSQGFSADEFPTLRSWSSWFSGDPSRPTVNRLNGEKKMKVEEETTDDRIHSEQRSVIVPDADVVSSEAPTDRGINDGAHRDVLSCEGNEDGDASEEDDSSSAQYLHDTSSPPPQVSSVTPLSKAEMAVLGMKIKRILDYGRILFIRKELHLEAEVIEYCSTTLSPENYAIISKPKR